MKHYLINDAAKKLNIESHVLRYWEEELQLSIERNKQGHRLYTEEDLNRFLYIKELKKEGLQLRAIREKVHKAEDWAKDVTQISQDENEELKMAAGQPQEMKKQEKTSQGDPIRNEQTGGQTKSVPGQVSQVVISTVSDNQYRVAETSRQRQEKAMKLCMMLQQMVGQAVKQENEAMLSELKKSVAETVSKEMDYQFRMQEQREEEHYQRIDALLREKSNRKRLFQQKDAKEKEKTRADKQQEKKKEKMTKAERDKEMLMEKKRRDAGT